MADDKAIVTEAANRYGISPSILWGLYGTETSFGKNTSTSSAGAVGPFQFLPSTAKGMGVNPNDFKSAAFGAARYLSQYKGRGVGGMLSAYNAGPAGGYQSGYVNTTLANAKSYGQAKGGSVLPPAPQSTPATPSKQVSELNQPAFQKAQHAAILGKLISSEGGAKDNPLFATGLVSTKAPSPAEYQQTRTIPGLPGAPAQAPVPPAGGSKLGGFLEANAPLEYKRQDEGQDVQLKPGQALKATGDFEVIAVHSDPSGFGPDYPVVKFTSGPDAGQSLYFGHGDSLVKQGQKGTAGTPLVRTSTTGHNAPPGWLEIGKGETLGQGNKGQGAQIAPYLRRR